MLFYFRLKLDNLKAVFLNFFLRPKSLAFGFENVGSDNFDFSSGIFFLVVVIFLQNQSVALVYFKIGKAQLNFFLTRDYFFQNIRAKLFCELLPYYFVIIGIFEIAAKNFASPSEGEAEFPPHPPSARLALLTRRNFSEGGPARPKLLSEGGNRSGKDDFPVTYLKIFRRRDPAKSGDKFFFGGNLFQKPKSRKHLVKNAFLLFSRKKTKVVIKPT